MVCQTAKFEFQEDPIDYINCFYIKTKRTQVGVLMVFGGIPEKYIVTLF